MTNQVALTTTDNPYSPFAQFDEWFAFDTQMGYNSCAYLARVARTSNGISDEDNAKAVEEAIDEIVSLNLTGNYKKVYKDGEGGLK